MGAARRNTPQKQAVRDALERLGNHPTADEVYIEAKRTAPSIGKATVYRTLGMLAEEGDALRVCAGQGADRFDGVTVPHSHAICTQCGQVVDVMLDPAAGVDERVAQETGFRIEGHALSFSGLCPACLARRDGETQRAS